MKQTALEYLVDLLETQKFITKSQIFIAQEMEKQQILRAAYHGANYESSPYKDAEDYYNKTFKSEKYDKNTNDSDLL
jgi:hypothetical protein